MELTKNTIAPETNKDKLPKCTILRTFALKITIGLTCLFFVMCSQESNSEIEDPEPEKADIPELIIQDTEPEPFNEDAVTIVVMPDTQGYTGSESNISILNQVIDWIVANKDERNIEMLVHVGDMTNNNGTKQWKRIRNTFKILDGKIPYVIAEGNHDFYKDRKTGEIVKRMNDYFNINQNHLNQEMFGSTFEEGKLENAYYQTNISGQKFIFLALELTPRNEVLAWANNIIQENTDSRIFIANHSFLSESSRLVSDDNIPGRFDSEESRVSNDLNEANDVYEKIIANNSNVEFLVCGHTGAVRLRKDGEPLNDFEKEKIANKASLESFLQTFSYDADIATGHRSDAQDDQLTCHQLLFNAQWVGDKDPETGYVTNKNGGDGWIMLMEFLPGNDRVNVKSYSPYLNKWRDGYEYNYKLNRSVSF